MSNAHELNIGKVLASAQGRDAIHVAIAPVIVAHDLLKPGTNVGFVPGSTGEVTDEAKPLVGIIDPYLDRQPRKGERVWMFLYPNTVTSLRHEWTHPAFPASDVNPCFPSIAEKPEVDAAKQFLARVASECGLSYARFMEVAEYAATDDDYYMHMGENEEYKNANWGADGEFWRHFETVTGIKATHTGTGFFSCSC